MSNEILIDWFAITSKVDNFMQLCDYLKLEGDSVDWVEYYGRYGYAKRMEFGGINIYYNHYNADTDYPMIEMSGQGCRTYETYSKGNWQDLFDMALDSENYNVKRIDIAYDDKEENILDIDTIVKAVEKREYLSKCRAGVITDSFNGLLNAKSVMLGSRSSELYIRIYDKAAERGGLDYHWVRCEIVLKNERALNFLKLNYDIGLRYKGILVNYIRFIIPDESIDENHRNRLKTVDWWERFLGAVCKVSVFSKKDIEYNMYHLEKFLGKQCGNSIETYIRCLGIDGLKELLKSKCTKLNANQLKLIYEYTGDKDVL